MTTHSGAFIDNFLEHYAVGYDPVKAKEYYEKNKRLKGRQTGANVGSGPRPTASPVATTSSAASSGGNPAQRAAKRAEANKAKVKAIRGKIDKLDNHLATLKKERRAKGTTDAQSDAKAESGSKKEESKTKESADKSEEKPAEKLSAADKAKKAKEARDNYESVAKKEPSEMSLEELDEKIATVRQRVKELKSRLRETLETNRSQA